MPAPLPILRPPPGAAALTAAPRRRSWATRRPAGLQAGAPRPPPCAPRPARRRRRGPLHLLDARRLFTHLEEHGGAYAAQPAADGPAPPADGDGAPGGAAEPATAREEPACAACACPASLRPDVRRRSVRAWHQRPLPGRPERARLGSRARLPCSSEPGGPRVSRPEPERPLERRPRDGEREARGREERERSRKRERQRERIEWQGERPGEREEGPRSTDKRRREEPREERAHGRQARRRVRAPGTCGDVTISLACREGAAPEHRGRRGLLPCAGRAPCQSPRAAGAGTAWVGAAPERDAADRAGGGAEAWQGPGWPRRGRRARWLARPRAPPRARQVRRVPPSAASAAAGGHAVLHRAPLLSRKTQRARRRPTSSARRCGSGRDRVRGAADEEPARERRHERERERERGLPRERHERERGAPADGCAAPLTHRAL